MTGHCCPLSLVTCHLSLALLPRARSGLRFRFRPADLIGPVGADGVGRLAVGGDAADLHGADLHPQLLADRGAEVRGGEQVPLRGLLQLLHVVGVLGHLLVGEGQVILQLQVFRLAVPLLEAEDGPFGFDILLHRGVADLALLLFRHHRKQVPQKTAQDQHADQDDNT